MRTNSARKSVAYKNGLKPTYVEMTFLQLTQAMSIGERLSKLHSNRLITFYIGGMQLPGVKMTGPALQEDLGQLA